MAVVRNVLAGGAPFASTHNLILTIIDKLLEGIELHPAIEISNGYSYTASRNTNSIEDIISSKAGGDNPFFVMANYMDAHFPYYPRESYGLFQALQNFKKYKSINESTGHPFSFLERTNLGTLEENHLPVIRDLYQREVETLDAHLNRIVTALESEEISDETLLIITADHGEYLAEWDDRGERRMGHHESVSDNHLKVPLLVANPNLEDRDISRPVESRKVYRILSEPELDSDSIVTKLQSNEPIALIEAPAHQDGSLPEKYPDLPNSFVNNLLYEHSVVAFSDIWKVAGYTSGEWYAWEHGKERPVSDAPVNLKRLCDQHLEKLTEIQDSIQPREGQKLSNETSQQLCDLGYM
jgi:hypothetical protein